MSEKTSLPLNHAEQVYKAEIYQGDSHKETQRGSSLCFQIVQLLKVMPRQMLKLIATFNMGHCPILQITTYICQDTPLYLQVR